MIAEGNQATSNVSIEIGSSFQPVICSTFAHTSVWQAAAAVLLPDWQLPHTADPHRLVKGTTALVSMSFQDTGLDHRILRALAKQGLTAPTPVQAAAIPAALEGKDVVARARTGSGKTLAYLLPALQRIVASSSSRQPWQVLVLVPTRELCDQVGAAAAAELVLLSTPVAKTLEVVMQWSEQFSTREAVGKATRVLLQRVFASAGQAVLVPLPSSRIPPMLLHSATRPAAPHCPISTGRERGACSSQALRHPYQHHNPLG